MGGTNIRGVLVDPSGQVAGSDACRRPADPVEMVDAIVGLVERLETSVGSVVAAVGVGCAGTVDHQGVVHTSPNIPTLIEFPLAAELASRLRRRAVVENDATTATWAEMQTGAGRGLTDVAFVALGTGIGMGLVLGGELQRGANGFAGEAGHMVVDAAGPECVCGRHGCWEIYASGRALGRLTRQAAREGRVPAIVESVGDIDSIESEHVSGLVAEGHPEALAVLDELGWWAGLGLTNLVNVLDVSAAIIGGGLSEMGEPLLSAIRRGFVGHQHDIGHRPAVSIELAIHGPGAGALGAAFLARHDP
jgi:glucokinase